MQFIKSIVTFITSLGNNMRKSDMEIYINSKKPSTHAEVERLLREYTEKQVLRGFV
jgi:hypothetical protein